MYVCVYVEAVCVCMWKSFCESLVCSLVVCISEHTYIHTYIHKKKKIRDRMYVCMYVKYVCMYVKYLCMYVKYEGMYVCIYAMCCFSFLHFKMCVCFVIIIIIIIIPPPPLQLMGRFVVCMYVCMYVYIKSVCMYVCWYHHFIHPLYSLPLQPPSIIS